MRFQPRGVIVAAALAVFAFAAPRARATGETINQALYSYETDIGSFNLMTLGGGATLNSYGSTQEGLAIDGNLNISAGSVATSGVNSNMNLYVSGSLSLTGTVQMTNGYASLPGETTSDYTWNSANQNLTSKTNGYALISTSATGTYATTSPLTNPGPGFSFSTAISDFTNASAAFASAATSGTISVSGGALTFTSNNPSPAAGSTIIFSLDASLISGSSYNGQSFTTVSITVPSDVNYVINVVNAAGTTLFGSAVTMLPGSNTNQLLWNIEGSGTVTLGGNRFYGAILAPSATIVNGNALITGQVVADSFTDNSMQLAYQGYDAVIVPEPGTYAFWGVALCGGAIMARRRFLP